MGMVQVRHHLHQLSCRFLHVILARFDENVRSLMKHSQLALWFISTWVCVHLPDCYFWVNQCTLCFIIVLLLLFLQASLLWLNGLINATWFILHWFQPLCLVATVCGNICYFTQICTSFCIKASLKGLNVSVKVELTIYYLEAKVIT